LDEQLGGLDVAPHLAPREDLELAGGHDVPLDAAAFGGSYGFGRGDGYVEGTGIKGGHGFFADYDCLQVHPVVGG
ncbi:MAG: hypothetical protein CEN92_254, partial [Candidatus Berkelbacteria bacterium Licking1014_96]